MRVIAVKKFYITTAIPYVNAPPHLGHALEFAQADAIRRFRELEGFSSFLATGADENSLKNVQAAEEEGIAAEKLCERNAELFRQLARDISLSFDSFLRSSVRKEHWRGVEKVWRLCGKRGDLYKRKYRGLYCVGCEAFYAESELEHGLCPEHKKRPEEVEEENYFFRLSKYQKRLERLIESGELGIIPETRKNEALAFIRSGLEDFSVSRSRKRAKGWGVPVPGDPKQIMYVWFDALSVYLTAAGYGKDMNKFRKWWPADVHVIGKGIIRFHAVYWPAMLMSAGLPLPKSLFVHGYITVEGQKMSKSLGNRVDPHLLIKKHGAERLRFYLLREMSPFDDGDFSERLLVEKTNAELADNFSNLFYRVTSFIERNFHGRVPEGKADARLKSAAAQKVLQYRASMESFRINEAAGHALELCSLLNKYFQDNKPWEKAKKNSKEAAAVLYNSANVLGIICRLLYPFIPETSKKTEKLIAAGKAKKLDGYSVKAGAKVTAEMLFTRAEAGKDINSAQDKKGEGGFVEIDDFRKLDLRVATITDVKDHPNAEKLYVLQADLGAEKRQLVAGLRGIYKKEELLGKQIILLANLKPAMLRGIESQGMLLAADDGTLVSPMRKVSNGLRIR